MMDKAFDVSERAAFYICTLDLDVMNTVLLSSTRCQMWERIQQTWEIIAFILRLLNLCISGRPACGESGRGIISDNKGKLACLFRQTKAA